MGLIGFVLQQVGQGPDRLTGVKGQHVFVVFHKTPVEVHEYPTPFAPILGFPGHGIMVDGTIAGINFGGNQIGEVLDVHVGRDTVIIGLNGQVFLDQPPIMVPGFQVAGLHIIAVFDQVERAFFHAVIGGNVVFIHLFPDVVDAHVLPVYIDYGGSEGHVFEIHVVLMAGLLN